MEPVRFVIPKVMISHRCIDYHGFLENGFEVLFEKYKIQYRYGCNLEHHTGIIDENIMRTLRACEGFIAVITSKWIDPKARWPQKEWITWTQSTKAIRTKCLAFLVDDAKPPSFISSLNHVNIYTSKIRDDLTTINESQHFDLFANKNDFEGIVKGLTRIAEPIKMTLKLKDD